MNICLVEQNYAPKPKDYHATEKSERKAHILGSM